MNIFCCACKRSVSTALRRIRRKQKVAIVLGFYGGNYGGMQVNDQKTSIEDRLIGTLYQLDKIENCNVYDPNKFGFQRCSRTDKGVSAAKMVVTAKLMDYDDEFGSDLHNQKAVKELNHKLPEDIRVFSYVRISKRFNSHANTFSREYSYFIPMSRLKQMGVRVNEAKLSESLSVFLGTHYMKNYTGAIRHRNRELRQFYMRTITSVSTQARTIRNRSYLQVDIVGNSFLYHQIRKIIGGSLATACGSWTPTFLRASFDGEGVAVPLAPGTPLCLRALAFRSDKRVFLNQKEYEKAMRQGKIKQNPNQTVLYKELILLNEEENRKSEAFFHSYILPRMERDIQRENKQFDDFVAHLHLGLTYDK